MLANVITGCRILFSVIILLVPVFSPVFYGCYLAAGFTDMIDGTIARKLGTDGEFGEKLDTMADIVFVAAAAYKILPVMEIPKDIWIWIGVISLIKIINIISGFVVAKQFVSVHTVANKITGLLVFLLPLTMAVVEL
ncbi:MAG: CDP-alcohol phosphatidyltransferase family protein, partial [Roseburia sp.]|nr:CDP-alcohol phosphatidyltransferase family protein [Roseburia sp.]